MEQRDFILEDFRHIAESYSRNETAGETRVNWLLGLTTAILTATIALLSADKRPPFDVLRWTVFLPTLVANLTFGIVTLLRMLKRDKVTDSYIAGLNKYRDAFANEQNSPPQIRQVMDLLRDKATRSFGGGLTNMVMVINSLIFAAICFVAVTDAPRSALLCERICSYAAAALGFGFAFGLQHLCVSCCGKPDQESREQP